MPETFTFLNPEVRLWVPLAFTAEERADDRRYSQNHDEIARLAPGATLAQARQRLDAQTARNRRTRGPLKSALVNAGYRTSSCRSRPISCAMCERRSSCSGAACVRAPHCRRQHHEPLARPRDRPHEGTGHEACARRGQSSRRPPARHRNDAADDVGRAARSAGGLLEPWRLASLGLADIPRAHEIRMDAVVVAFSLGGWHSARDRVGAVPAMHLSGDQPQRRAAGGRPNRDGRPGRAVHTPCARRRAGRAGVRAADWRGAAAGQLPPLLTVDPGFQAEHVLTGRVSPLAARIPTRRRLRSYSSRALERIRALPGIEAAGATSFLPFSWDSSSSVIIPEGYVMAPGESVVSPNQLYVTPGTSRRCAFR